jgi:hypothetical protein
MLAAPLPPGREIGAREEGRPRRADELLDRLRAQLKDGTSKAPKRVETPSAQTIGESSDPDAKAVGTRWSVVVSPAQSSGDGSAPSAAADADAARSEEAQPTPDQNRLPPKRYVDILGGLVAAICVLLTVRQRVKSQRLASGH